MAQGEGLARRGEHQRDQLRPQPTLTSLPHQVDGPAHRHKAVLLRRLRRTLGKHQSQTASIGKRQEQCTRWAWAVVGQVGTSGLRTRGGA